MHTTPAVHNAIPLMGFDNMMPSYQVLKAMFKTIPHLKTTPDEFMVISPDEGALNRNMYYASMLGVPMGMFYKRRDYAKIINGHNPIVAHEYLGNSVRRQGRIYCRRYYFLRRSMLILLTL